MPLPRFYKLPLEKRRLILEQARGEFARHGYDGASLNRIIAAAGISKGSMYYYFTDKGDLYSAVLDEVFDFAVQLLAELPPIHDREDYWRVLELGMDRLQEAFLGDAEMAALGRHMYRAGAATPGFAHLTQRFEQAVARLIAKGQELHAIRADLPTALLAHATSGLVLAIDRWLTEAALEYSPEELAPLIPAVKDLLKDLLCPRDTLNS